jgi:hypothetical protein
MAACDTLLQELNIVYAYDSGLKPESVRWNSKNKNKFMKKLPEKIFTYIEEERKKDWFCKVQSYRNRATHQYIVPLGSTTTWVGTPSNYSEHQVFMFYLDSAGNRQDEEIKVCETYLNSMVGHVRQVWEEMAQEFD